MLFSDIIINVKIFHFLIYKQYAREGVEERETFSTVTGM